ncbi:potassium-transporting ATPase subunit F [Neptunitalea chrysea]|uniref:Potassium-transporting ATPase subunit F n=1 Tax=Neptunitalea chrysea TaxID=1647581 RepID=A0A9W6EWE0_9FLAO|nr:SRPBCC family protein [Neptunitalea chrysea]GLB53752.1 potassium-transporting ATPase subunit F [Neptunitalea chrysea]
MMTLIYILLILVTLVLFLAFVAPKTYNVSRSVIVERPAAEVYNFLKYLKNQDSWSPWNKKDPNMKKTFTGTDGEIGFISAWEGNKDVGAGEQELTNFVEGSFVQSKLRFFKPWKSESDAYLRVEEVAIGAKVTWGFAGKNPFPFSIFMLFMNMDKAVGKDFEEGLQNLKDILEKPEN